MPTKKQKLAIVLSVLVSLVIVLSTCLTLFLPKRQELSALQFQNMLKNLNQEKQLESSLEDKDFDPVIGQDYGDIYQFANDFNQSQLEVNQVTTEKSLSNLGLIEGISFFNLSQEGYYNLISELHPVDIYGRYVPFTIDRTWTKPFWADDYLKIDPNGPLIDAVNNDDIWNADNFSAQMDVFEEALQDLDYGFQINSRSPIYDFLEKKYGYAWVQRMQESYDYSQMIGNSDNSNSQHTNDDFTYKTSFRIILEVPSIIDHIEISMPRYYDGMTQQRGTIGIEKMTITDVYGNDFVTQMTNKDFHTNGKNFEDNSDNVITVPYHNANIDNPEMGSDTFADVWWNKFYLGSVFDTEPHVWTLDNSRDQKSSLGTELVSSYIMDGFTQRLLSVNAPRGYVPLFVNANSYLLNKEGFLNQIPQLKLDNFSLGFYENDFSLGTVTVTENQRYYLFFLKANFNIYEDFGASDNQNINEYLTKANNNFLIVPPSTNLEEGVYELDSQFLANVKPIIGLRPFFTFINWDFFQLPKNPFNNENVVYARYKIDYNASLDESYKEDNWNYVDLDKDDTSKLWLNEGSIITIEFYPKDNYRVINQATRKTLRFSSNYVIEELDKKSDSSLNDMDIPGTYANSLIGGNSVINTVGDLSNLGLVSEVELYIKMSYKNSDSLFWPKDKNNKNYNTTISEVNFFDASWYSVPYNITYYSYDEGFSPGDIYSREQYLRMTRLWNDGDTTLQSFTGDSGYTYPFSVDNRLNTAFGNYNNYLLYRHNTEVKVRFTFDVPILLSSIRLGAGAYWIEDVPWISKINVTKSNGDKYSSDILRASRRVHPATDTNGGTPKKDSSFSGERGSISDQPEVDTVTYAYLNSYYGISSLSWVKEEPISFTTNGSLSSIGPVTSGSISFWAQQANFSNMHISDITIYDQFGIPIPYKITYTSHLPGIRDDISNPEIMKKFYEVFEKTNLTTNKNYYYTAPMSALFINWYEYADQITINKNNRVWQETLNNISYNTDFLEVFNFINTYLQKNPSLANWNQFKNDYYTIFSGNGAEKLLNTMESMINNLKANNGKAFVLNHKDDNKNPTFRYGDVNFDYLIVDFQNISFLSAIKKVYATLQAAELSNWGGNNLTQIFQDGKDSTALELGAYNWEILWADNVSVDYKNLASDIPYLDIEFVFEDNLPHIIGSIEIRSKGVDDLIYTSMEERNKSPRRIDLSLNTATGERFNAKYIKGVQHNGDPFNLSTTNPNYNIYYDSNFGKGEINWSNPSINIDDHLGINVLKLEDLLSRKLFAQAYNEENNTWENIDDFKIQSNETIKIRFGFYWDTARTIQGIFKTGSKWVEFYWKPPTIESKKILYKEFPTNIPFEGINGYGSFDISILKYSNEFDIEITIDKGKATEKVYFNNLPWVLKNGQSLTIKLIAKKGALFYKESGETTEFCAKSYIVKDLSQPISLSFDEEINLNSIGDDGWGVLSFDYSLIPDQLNWQIRVARGETVSTYPPQTLPNKLFNGDIVYLDILSKNGYLINNQLQVYDYAHITIDNLAPSEEINPPQAIDFENTKFTNLEIDRSKYVIKLESKTIFQSWEENKNVNVIYNIFDDTSFEPIARNIKSINDSRLIFEKGQRLEIILTPANKGVVFKASQLTPAQTEQKIVVTITIDDDHIEQTDKFNYLSYETKLLPQEINIKGGNEEGSIYFDSGILEYSKFANLGFETTIYLFDKDNPNKNLSEAKDFIGLQDDSAPFALDTRIFENLKNGDCIKIVAGLQENGRWIEDISLDAKLVKEFTLNNLKKYASQEMIPQLNLNIKGYEEHNTLDNFNGTLITGDPNALIPNLEDWMKRNPDVFVGVYLIRGNDLDRIRDLVLRDPENLPFFNAATGTGYRLDPTKPIKNLKNGDEILYYIAPKNKDELLYGDQSSYIFNYKINNLKISLLKPNLVYIGEKELAQNLSGLNNEAYFLENLLRINVIDDLFNDMTIKVTFNNGHTEVFHSIAGLLAIKNFANGMKIEFDAKPKLGYFWGTDLNDPNAFGIKKTFEFSSIPEEFQTLPLPDAPDFNSENISFSGANGEGFVNDININIPANTEPYLSVFNEKHQQIYFWSIYDIKGNLLLNQEKYHLLKNGYFVKIVFWPSLGYIFDKEDYPETKEIEVTGLKKSIFDYGISKYLIQGLIGLNGEGQVLLPWIDPKMGRFEIKYQAPNSDTWITITADDKILTNGGKIIVTLFPNHDNGYIVDYETWKINPTNDFFKEERVISSLSKKITREFIEETLTNDFGINVNDLSKIAWNDFPEGYTTIKMNSDLQNAFNLQYNYYIYVYDGIGNLVEKISIKDLKLRGGVTKLLNGYTIKLFAVSKVGYKFDVDQIEQDLSEWIKETHYTSDESSGASIGKPLVTNDITFYTNKTNDINSLVFYLNLKNENKAIPSINSKDDLLKYFNFKITISKTKEDRNNQKEAYDESEDIILDLDSEDIFDFTYQGNRIFTFKIHNLTAQNTVKLVLEVKEEYAAKWKFVSKTYSTDGLYVNLEDAFRSEIDLEFARNILLPPPIDKLQFVDNNVVGEAVLDSVKMGLFNEYYDYYLQIVRNGIILRYKIDSSTSLPPFELNDLIAIEAKIKNEYTANYAFEFAGKKVLSLFLFEQILDSNVLQLAINLPNLTLDDFNFVGPSGFSKIVDHPLLDINNVVLSYELTYQNNVVREYNKLTDLPSNLSNGMRLKIKVKPIIASGLLIDSDGKTYSEYVYDYLFENLNEPISAPNFNQAILFKATIENKVLIDINWEQVFSNPLNLEHLNITLLLRENVWVESPIIKSSGPWKLSEFIENNKIAEFNPQIGNLVQIYLEADSGYEFTQYNLETVEKTFVVTEVQSIDIKIDNLILPSLSYAENGDISTLAHLSDEWAKMLEDLLANNIDVTFEVWKKELKVATFKNQLPIDLANDQQVKMILNVTNPEYWNITYQNAYYKTLSFTYDVTSLRTIIDFPDFPDKLKYSGFQNQVVVNKPNLLPDIANKIQVKYQVSRNGGSFSDPLAVLPTNLTNGDKVKIVYQIKGEYVFYNGATKEVSTSIVSQEYTLEKLKILVPINFKDQVFLVENGDNFGMYDYQKDITNISFEYYVNNQHQESENLPKEFDVSKGIDIHLYVKNSAEQAFFDNSSEIVKHYNPDLYEVINLPNDLEKNALTKNKFDDNYTFDSSSLPNYFEVIITDKNGNKVIKNLNNLSPGLIINIRIKTRIDAFYLISDIELINYQIAIPSANYIKHVDVSDFNNITFEGIDGDGTIANIAKYNSIFNDENIRITFKTKHNDEITKWIFVPDDLFNGIPNHLYNGDELYIEMLPINTNVETISNYPLGGFSYKVKDLISPETGSHAPYINTSLYISLALVSSMVLIGSLIVARKIRVG